MAQNGGGASPPRVHRPRAPIMSVPAPLTAPLTPLRLQPPVSLSAPRPENERAANEYVETPVRPVLPPTPPPPQPPRLHRPPRPPVTKQPQPFKEPPPQGAECAARASIMCPECGRCRCDSCQLPRPLPFRWVCHDSCLLSADSIIDYATCLCCVKGLFYHCSESDGGAAESCADNPCGCGVDRRKARWGCLGALSFVLPCLWLYWPLRGCKHVVEVCYARHSRTGCRCRQPLATPEKRLLDSSPD